MNDLISRQAAIAELKREASCGDRDYEKGLLIAADILELFPSAEKHGRWIIKKDACGKNYTVCSNCNTSIEWRDRRGVLLKVDMETANFCPNCGAYMRETDSPCGGCDREDKENCSYCEKMERSELRQKDGEL